MTSTIRVDNFGPSAGGTTYSARGIAKAWVNFNGTGTIAVRDSENVSSLTDNGTGDYTVNIGNDMANGNYLVLAGGNTNVTTGGANFFNSPAYQAQSGASIRLATFNQASSNTDMEFVMLATHGDLA